MRRAVLTLVLLVSTASVTSAAEGSRRSAFKEKQAPPSVWLAPLWPGPTAPAVSDIPIIPLPASLRPKRPPAASPL
jgi:hypothetical protein